MSPWTILTKSATLIVFLVSIVNLAFGQTENKTDLALQEAMKVIDKASNAASYVDDPSTPWNETADPERTEAEIEKKQLKQEMMQTMKTQLELIINNCYVHSDRPNPVQDLIDKGLLNAETWKNETCKSTKQAYDSLLSQGY
jgi:hypothetical protein